MTPNTEAVPLPPLSGGGGEGGCEHQDQKLLAGWVKDGAPCLVKFQINRPPLQEATYTGPTSPCGKYVSKTQPPKSAAEVTEGLRPGRQRIQSQVCRPSFSESQLSSTQPALYGGE